MATAELTVKDAAVHATVAGFDVATADPTGRLILADWYAEQGYLAAEKLERAVAKQLTARVTFGQMVQLLRKRENRQFRWDLLGSSVEAAQAGGCGMWTNAHLMFRMRPKDRARLARETDPNGWGRTLGNTRTLATMAGALSPIAATVGPDVTCTRWFVYTEDRLAVCLRGGPAIDVKYWRFLTCYFPGAEWRWDGGVRPVSLHDSTEAVAIVMPVM